MINIILLSILLCGLVFSVELTAPVYKVFRTGGFETIQSPKDSSTIRFPKELAAIYERKGNDYLGVIMENGKEKSFFLTNSRCELKQDSPELGLLAGSFSPLCPVDPERDEMMTIVDKTLIVPSKRIKVDVDYDNDGKIGEIGYLFYQDLGIMEIYSLLVYNPRTKLLKYSYTYIHNRDENSKRYILKTYEVKIEVFPQQPHTQPPTKQIPMPPLPPK